MNERELRARLAHAVQAHGTAAAHLKPDGSIEVVVPDMPNDIERARAHRAESKKKWRGVTNELVTSHANPHCADCGGNGYTGPEEAGEVCDCAEQLFAVAYRGKLRWNQRKGRVEVFV